MNRMKSQNSLFHLSAMAVAMVTIYPVAHAEGLILKDGGTHEAHDTPYDYVEIRHGTPKTKLTTLNASGLTINDARTDANHGAVFTKGGTIVISDSVINTTGKRSGLQAFSTQSGEAPTTIDAENIEIRTAGTSAHGVFLYFERNAGSRSDTNITISDSQIATEGERASGLLVGG